MIGRQQHINNNSDLSNSEQILERCNPAESYYEGLTTMDIGHCLLTDQYNQYWQLILAITQNNFSPITATTLSPHSLWHYHTRWPSVPFFSEHSWMLMACPGKITRSLGMLNCPEFQNPSWFCHALNVMSHTYIKFVDIRCIHSSSKCNKSIFGRGLCPGPHWGSLWIWCSPDSLVSWGGGMQCPNSVLPEQCLDFLS